MFLSIQSWKVEDYILTYFYLEKECGNRRNEERFDELNIERIKREFKTHCSAIDFGEMFINHCLLLKKKHPVFYYYAYYSATIWFYYDTVSIG
jgi:hypothetical protein